MKRITILFTNFGPYHIARIKALHQHCQSRGWEVIGIELARSEQDYDWNVDLQQVPFPIVTVVSTQLEQVPFQHLSIKLIQTLSDINPDAVAIAGYARPSMLVALWWSAYRHKAAILMSETHEQDTQRVFWREIPKQLLLKAFKASLVGGKPHQQYLLKLGVRPESIFLGYDVVDNDIFHPSKIRTLHRPVAQPYFLSINRFIPKKNLSFLLTAYAEYRKIAGTLAYDLVISGDGALRPQLETQIKRLGIENAVHLPGFLQQKDLLPYFAYANCFIHTSTHEQWGLVVNEAMAAGLPVLVSDRCGCFEDLVIEGINGFGFDPTQPSQLADLMLKISSQAVDIEAMGQAALNQIQKFSPDYFAQGLVQAMEYAVGKTE